MPVKRIRIIQTPPGMAPEWVRKAWIGLNLPTMGRENSSEASSGLRFGTENLGGYKVDGTTALNLLARHNPDAHRWWHDNLPLGGSTVIFKAEVCVEIED